MLPGDIRLDIKHSLRGDHGSDFAQSAILDTVSFVHNTVHDLRLGMQDTRQHRTIGQLLVAYNHRLRRIDKIMDAVETKRSQKFITLGDNTMVINDWRWWIENESMLDDWMDANIAKGRHAREGMIIDFDSSEDFLLFLLTWQGPNET